MKVRKGFVSNSSSSSFICDLCGNVESGYDMAISDFEMIECENELHVFCKHHFNNLDEITIKGDYDRVIKSEYCPICNMSNFTYNEIIKYLKKTNIYDKIIEEIKQKFKNYEEFNIFISRK